jgi:hypothetical protein
MKRPALCALAGLVWIGVLGCSGSRVANELEGKISYNGAAVTGGSIKFHPEGGGSPLSGYIKHDGNYIAENIPPGKVTVTIETESVKKSTPAQGMPQMKQKPPPGVEIKAQPQLTPTNMPVYVKIPAKYADPKKSGLTFEVTKGKVKKDFDLTD